MHSPSVLGAGDHVSTLVAMALSEFSMKKKKSCAPPVEQQMLTKTPPQNKRFSANPQGDGNRNRDTAALAEEYAQNSKTIIRSQEQ